MNFKLKKKIAALVACVLMTTILTGCSIASILSSFKDVKGDLIGIGFNVSVYDNVGKNILNLQGDKVSVESNTVKEKSYNSAGDTETHYKLSSVITTTVDGYDFSQTGNTVIYAEKGLKPVADFSMSQDITTTDNGSIAFVDKHINKIKNLLGAPKTIVISSQMGVPIAVYEGRDVYYEIPDDLPKMTKLVIDGKALYVHRANYMILDTALIK